MGRRAPKTAIKDEGQDADMAPAPNDEEIHGAQEGKGAAVAEGDEGGGAADRDASLPKHDDSRFEAREAIASKRREKRAEQVDQQDEGAREFRRLAGDEGVLDDDTRGGDEGGDGGGGSNAAANDASDPILTLTIDGQKVQMKQSEVIARAQMAGAAENRLRELNTALDEVKQLRAGATGQTNAGGKPDDSQTGKPAPSAADQPDRKARAAALVRDIQMGDADEEMADRLLSLVDEARSEGLSREEVMAAAREEYRREQDERETQDSFARIAQANEPLVNNRYVRETFFGELIGQALKELREVVGMDDDGINTILRGTDRLTPNQLVRINHDHFRRMTNPDGTPAYPKLSKQEALMKGAATRAIKEWNETTGANLAFVDPSAPRRPTASGTAPVTDRSGRKRAIETHQAPANVSSAAGVTRMGNRAPQPLTREASKRAGFADIKAGRQTGQRR